MTQNYFEVDYKEGTNDLIISLMFEDDVISNDFREVLSAILNSIDSCDTYCISEDFESYGNFDGYLRLLNINRNCVYYLFGKDIEDLKHDETITLEAHEANEDDIEDFERMF